MAQRPENIAMNTVQCKRIFMTRHSYQCVCICGFVNAMEEEIPIGSINLRVESSCVKVCTVVIFTPSGAGILDLSVHIPKILTPMPHTYTNLWKQV